MDPDLNLVKGRGGALLREKARRDLTACWLLRAGAARADARPCYTRWRQMVELASKKFVCIVDDTKMVTGLGGSKLAMPVEVTPFCYKARAGGAQAAPGGSWRLRAAGACCGALHAARCGAAAAWVGR